MKPQKLNPIHKPPHDAVVARTPEHHVIMPKVSTDRDMARFCCRCCTRSLICRWMGFPASANMITSASGGRLVPVHVAAVGMLHL